MAFEPLMNYASPTAYEHILNALPCFVHPVSGNSYGIAIEKVGGVRQDLSVYRVRPGATTRELVRRYIGGADSAAQIAAGGCVIQQDGSLWVWASAVPPGQPNITKTGFVGGFWEPIPGVDAPWSAGGAPGPAGPVGPPGPPGSGGVVLFDRLMTHPAWEGRQMANDAGELVDIPATFGVPVANSYLMRFCVQAPAANVRGRLGIQQAPALYTLNTPAPNVQEQGGGWAHPQCWVSTAQGACQIWLQVVGYS